MRSLDVTRVADARENTVYEEEIVYVGDDERIYVLDTHQVGDESIGQVGQPRRRLAFCRRGRLQQ